MLYFLYVWHILKLYEVECTFKSSRSRTTQKILPQTKTELFIFGVFGRPNYEVAIPPAAVRVKIIYPAAG